MFYKKEKKIDRSAKIYRLEEKWQKYTVQQFILLCKIPEDFVICIYEWLTVNNINNAYIACLKER